MEVKIGTPGRPARGSLQAALQTPGEVEAAVTSALGTDSGVLGLTDDKGRRFLVHAAKIAYVEIGVADALRKWSFGIGSGAAKTELSGACSQPAPRELHAVRVLTALFFRDSADGVERVPRRSR